MKKFLLIICFISFFILSCDLNNSKNNNPRRSISWSIPDGEKKEYELGEENEFYAQNLTTYKHYSLKANLRYIGEYCNVWLEKDNDIHQIAIDTIGKAYDEDIYPKLMEYFGTEFELEDGNTYNTMQIADFMGNYDGKLCILLLDIIDGYTQGRGYVAGYFSSLNFYDNYPGVPSNKRDMIYIDTHPGTPGDDTSKEIVAHEMQHLMNFVTRQMLSEFNNQPSQMDLWINEGLSAAAEWSVFGHSKSRIDDYNSDRGRTIAKGNNFFVWDQHRNESVLDDYSTVYLFFQWLRLQNDTQIYKKIIESNYPDYRAVTENTIGYTNYNWGELIGDWLRANFVNSPTGIHGYRGDPAFNNLAKHYIINDNNSLNVSLFPGEGVFSYSPTPLTTVPNPSGNIRYINIKLENNNARLTYNVNPLNRGRAETGTITGQTPPGTNTSSLSRSILSGSYIPYAISIEEMLRRNHNFN